MTYLLVSRGWRRDFPPRPLALLLGFLLFPVWIDGWANGLGFWNTPGELRYFTGLLVGLSLPLLLVPLCRLQVESSASSEALSRGSSLRNSWDLIGLFAVGLFFLFVLSQPWGAVLWNCLAYLALLGTISLAVLAVLAFRAALKTCRTKPVESG